MEPEQQTSRAEKDRFGVLAYPVSLVKRPEAAGEQSHSYRVQADDELIEPSGSRIYLVNSGMTGSGLRIMPGYSIEDGLLDCFLLDQGTSAPSPAPPRASSTFAARPRPAISVAAGRSRCPPSRPRPYGPTASTSGGHR